MFALILVAVVFAVWFFTQSRTLFHVSIRGGKTLLVSGRIPSALLSDIQDIVHRERIQRGAVRAIADEHRVRIVSRGLSDGVTQRVRNVSALYSIQAMRAAPLVRKPTLGQTLGIAWLAWLLAPSSD